MSAYWLARVTITDTERFKAYADVAPAIITKHGGQFLAGGGDTRILEGTPDHELFFVIMFPSIQHAEACYKSDEYQAAIEARRGAGNLEIVVVDGASPLARSSQ